MITVTKPYLPIIGEYQQYIEKIWASGWLTNNGPFVQELETQLSDFLQVKHLYFTNNGTISLQIGIKALDLKGEIITTPFSYVATTNSIIWENCRPVFVDIDPHDLTIDADKIVERITEHTTAILATHVYGHPCDVEAIQAIANEKGLKVIYDAAHAFGVRYKGKSLIGYGDISVCSFHATKLFHTIEGGALVTNDDALAERIMLYRQFGHIGDEYFCIGINGKSSEMHAAMGLCILPAIGHIIDNRKLTCERYDENLKGSSLQRPGSRPGTEYNYAYYPVIFENEQQLLKSKDFLANCGIYTRRYFYPSLNNLSFVAGESCPVSEDISPRILALPLYYGLRIPEVDTITDYLLKSLRK